MFIFLNEHIRTYTYSGLLDLYKENLKLLEEYLSFLFSNDLIFAHHSISEFPPIRLEERNPSKISHIIIDRDENSTYSISKVVSILDTIGCFYVEIRFFCTMSYQEIEEIVSFFDETRVKKIDIYIKYSSQTSSEESAYRALINKNLRLRNIYFHSSSSIKSGIEIKEYFGTISYIAQNILDEFCCGQISQDYFSPQLQTIVESKKYNTCLNKKLAIDKEGYIKNCPAFKNNYGSISNTNIEELLNIISSDDFRRFFYLTKVQIESCKCCEYRDICTDCRAFHESDYNFKKPLKCKYNPLL